MLPAWDVAAGLYLALGILAAERVRARNGKGQEVALALSDVMLATVGNLGYIADVQVNGTARAPIGNYLYGAFGRDFATADGRRVMLPAISNRQWQAIGKATGLRTKLEMIGASDRTSTWPPRAVALHSTSRDCCRTEASGLSHKRWTRFARLWTAPAFYGAGPGVSAELAG